PRNANPPPHPPLMPRPLTTRPPRLSLHARIHRRTLMLQVLRSHPAPFAPQHVGVALVTVLSRSAISTLPAERHLPVSSSRANRTAARSLRHRGSYTHP